MLVLVIIICHGEILILHLWRNLKKKKKLKQALNKSYLPCIPTAKHLFSTENSRTVMKVIGREFGLKWFCLCRKIKKTSGNSKSVFVYSPIDMMQSTICENLRWTNLKMGLGGWWVYLERKKKQQPKYTIKS